MPFRKKDKCLLVSIYAATEGGGMGVVWKQ